MFVIMIKHISEDNYDTSFALRYIVAIFSQLQIDKNKIRSVL